MISAVVLTPDDWTGSDLAHEREVVVRSMIWLVSAVVSGLVRDVTLAVPAGLGLGDLADQSGCMLVQAETESMRLSAALHVVREPRLVLIKAGYQPDGGLIEELDVFIRRKPNEEMAVILSTPVSLAQRLFPHRAAPVGCLVTRARAEKSGSGLGRLLRTARRDGDILTARARPIL